MRRFAVLSFFWVARAMAQYRPSKGLQKNRKETKALKKLVKYLNFTSFCPKPSISGAWRIYDHVFDQNGQLADSFSISC